MNQVQNVSKTPDFNLYLCRFFTALAAVLFCVQFFYAYHFSLDIPFADSWMLFERDGVQDAFDPEWIFRFHNEHRIAITKFFAWLIYKINGLNLLHMLVVLHLFFAGLMGVCYFTLREEFKSKFGWLIPFGLCLSFSPINWENHSLPFNIHFHSSILFSILFLHCILRSEIKWSHVFWGAMTAFLAVFSFAAGLLAVLAGLIVFLISVFFDLKDASPKNKKTRLAQAAVITTYTLVFIGLYFKGYQRPAHHPVPLLPITFKFWRFYAEVLSLGFGLRNLSLGFSLLTFFVVHIPGVYLFFRTKALKLATTQERLVFAVWLGLLLPLLSIASGRAGFGLTQAKAMRYAEWGLICVPFTLYLWVNMLHKFNAWRNVRLPVALALFTFLTLTFWDEWGFPGAYVNWYNHLTRGQDCVVEFYSALENGKNPLPDASCPYIGSGDLSPNLLYAKKRGFSFYHTAVRKLGVQ